MRAKSNHEISCYNLVLVNLLKTVNLKKYIIHVFSLILQNIIVFCVSYFFLNSVVPLFLRTTIKRVKRIHKYLIYWLSRFIYLFHRRTKRFITTNSWRFIFIATCFSSLLCTESCHPLFNYSIGYLYLVPVKLLFKQTSKAFFRIVV